MLVPVRSCTLTDCPMPELRSASRPSAVTLTHQPRLTSTRAGSVAMARTPGSPTLRHILRFRLVRAESAVRWVSPASERSGHTLRSSSRRCLQPASDAKDSSCSALQPRRRRVARLGAAASAPGTPSLRSARFSQPLRSREARLGSAPPASRLTTPASVTPGQLSRLSSWREPSAGRWASPASVTSRQLLRLRAVSVVMVATVDSRSSPTGVCARFRVARLGSCASSATPAQVRAQPSSSSASSAVRPATASSASSPTAAT
mmetsp:Transcript_13552/g.35095  ORF Transcript_13552/g.35095 Transcript_13552/m.35095 type:complete len:261 (+) Transcript_13552:136-918(+)